MTVRRLQAIGSLQEQVQDTVRSLQELNEEERKNMLYSITSCATKERGLEDLEQRVSDHKELGWTQKAVEGRWQDGNQLLRTVSSFPVFHS